MASQTSISEETANTLTHAAGALLFVIGSAALLIKAYDSHNFWKILSAYIYGSSLITLYLASTLYHASTNPKSKIVFRLIDHSAIFLLIAGTYTPFLLVSLRDQVHISFIMTMWGIAVAGIIYKLFFLKRHKLVSTIIYLAMGWMAVLKVKTFYTELPVQASIWILIGGLFYSLGTIVYSKERMKYHHATWHLFVLCGSVSHFIVIYLYIY